MCTLHIINRSALTILIPSNIRSCQSGTWSAEQEHIRRTSTKLRRDHQNKNTQNDKKKETNTTKHLQEKYEGHSIVERASYSASCEPSDTRPDRNDRAFAPKDVASISLYSQGFRFFYRHSRSRLGSFRVGPINAALKHLKLAIVTPGAT